MWIEYPFLDSHLIDTAQSDALIEGPSLEEMQALEQGQVLGSVLEFQTVEGRLLISLENLQQDKQVPDAWWLSGWVVDDPSAAVVGAHYCPDRRSESYYCYEHHMISAW